MKDKFYVPFGTAKALKEKGYQQDDNLMFYEITEGKLRYQFFEKDDSIVIGCSNEEDWVAAPTYYEVVDWLESKRVYIEYDIYPCCNAQESWTEYIAQVSKSDGRVFVERYTTEIYHTREEALNAAILKALELI